MFEIIPFERTCRRMQTFDPFRDFADMERTFWQGNMTSFRTDVSDDGKTYTVEAELPGFKKEEINVDITSDRLTITAEHSSESESDDEKKNFVRKERFYGSYSRSFDISGIDADAISAEYTDGILTLSLPRQEPVAPTSRRLEIQ